MLNVGPKANRAFLLTYIGKMRHFKTFFKNDVLRANVYFSRYFTYYVMTEDGHISGVLG